LHVGFLKYVTGVTTSIMTFVPSFMKIGLSCLEDTEVLNTHTHKLTNQLTTKKIANDSTKRHIHWNDLTVTI
jgi:hypothetical protein